MVLIGPVQKGREAWFTAAGHQVITGMAIVPRKQVESGVYGILL